MAWVGLLLSNILVDNDRLDPKLFELSGWTKSLHIRLVNKVSLRDKQKILTETISSCGELNAPMVTITSLLALTS